MSFFFGKLYPRIFEPAYFSSKSLLKWLSEKGSKLDSGILVDFGCGQKKYKKVLLGKRTDIKYFGFDLPAISSDMHDISACAEVYCNLEKIPLKIGSVDIIYSNYVMQYLKNPESFLNNCCNLLKKKGKLMIVVPHISPLTSENYDFVRLTEVFFKNILIEHNFRNIEVSYCGNFAVTVITMINKSLYHYVWANSKIKSLLKILLTPFLIILLLIINLSGLLLTKIRLNKNYYPTNLFVYAEK